MVGCPVNTAYARLAAARRAIEAHVRRERTLAAARYNARVASCEESMTAIHDDPPRWHSRAGLDADLRSGLQQMRIEGPSDAALARMERVYEGRAQIGAPIVSAGRIRDSGGHSVGGTMADAPLHLEALRLARVRSAGPPATTPATVEISSLPTSRAMTAAPPTAGAPEPRPHVEPVQSVVDARRREAKAEDGSDEVAQVGEARKRAHELIGDGRFGEALALVERVLKDNPDGYLLWLRADAQRALGRDRNAALAYEAAARMLGGQAGARAGYRAAELWLHALHQPTHCLELLDRVWADATPSRVRELALVLRVEALLAAGREGDAARAAERYLALEPRGDAVPYMLGVLGW